MSGATFSSLGDALAARTALSADVDDIPPDRLPPGGFRKAAVLVPLFYKYKETEPSVFFTRRRSDLRLHAGQVSFPGGQVDPDDRDTLATALREAHEEVGLPPDLVQVLGRLDECLVLTSGFRLTPWVGCVPYPYPYVARPEEVAEIMEAPLAELARPEIHRIETLDAHGMRREVHIYSSGRLTIWGATARILNQLLAVWTSLS